MSKGIVTYIEDLRNEVLIYTQSNLAFTTHKLYLSAFKNLITYLGNKPIKLITTKQLDDYKTYRVLNISKSTVNIELTCIKAIFNLALKWNLINSNPAQYVQKFRIEQNEILCFNDIELKYLLGKMPNGDIKNIALFGLYTGCRLNEILNMQNKDINLGEKIVYVRNKPGFRTKSGKLRELPVSDSLYTLLESILKHDSNVYRLLEPERYLFTSPRGLKYERDFVSKKFKKYLRAFKMPEKFHFHCLRHTFITKLIKAGVNINYVRILAGHSELSTTMNYIHIVTDDMREAVNTVRQFTDCSY